MDTLARVRRPFYTLSCAICKTFVCSTIHFQLTINYLVWAAPSAESIWRAAHKNWIRIEELVCRASKCKRDSCCWRKANRFRFETVHHTRNMSDGTRCGCSGRRSSQHLNIVEQARSEHINKIQSSNVFDCSPPAVGASLLQGMRAQHEYDLYSRK